MDTSRLQNVQLPNMTQRYQHTSRRNLGDAASRYRQNMVADGLSQMLRKQLLIDEELGPVFKFCCDILEGEEMTEMSIQFIPTCAKQQQTKTTNSFGLALASLGGSSLPESSQNRNFHAREHE